MADRRTRTDRRTDRRHAFGARVLTVLAAGFGAGSPAGAVAPECRTTPVPATALTAVDARGELAFASGARGVLDGLRWPEAPDRAQAARIWLLAHAGTPLTLVARGETDRWGRVHLDATGADGTADLAGGLVEAGLAAVDAGERDSLCRPGLLAVEAGARGAGRGLWREADQDARDGAALRTRLGRFVVASGRVLWVGERARRTYLDFARRGEDGLTVTVSKRTWRQLQERGLSAVSLRERLVRVRGVVEVWRGPTLDVASADMIEILDAAQGR
ncbi:thermonuclease family protein [Methylobacterium sp. J-090]|uniref:thermonuclease family protein n=1 Tax=Methylobacterium sp. J-090 TaxID=2836666 RepID=UPI001FBA1901|nr:DNA-binding protein [Methylobacterium sp. J-090]MCJ2082734.1 DNA-binding protein [Methylobacterium sp. J-090]